jgi:hypothetical protein
MLLTSISVALAGYFVIAQLSINTITVTQNSGYAKLFTSLKLPRFLRFIVFNPILWCMGSPNSIPISTSQASRKFGGYGQRWSTKAPISRSSM